MFISPTVAGDNVLIGSCAGSVYALDRADGTLTWHYDTAADGPPAEFHGEPLLIGGTLIIPSDTKGGGHVYSFDAATGELRWKVPFKHGVAASPLLVSGRVVVVSAEGEVAAIDPKTGTIGWRVSPAGPLKPPLGIPSPVAGRDRIFVADNAGKVFALGRSNGKTIWTTPLAARANTSLALAGNTIIVGTIDGFLNWIDARSGKITQRVRFGGHAYGTLISAPPLLFVLVSGEPSKLLALDPKSGKVRWEQETPKEWTTYRPLVTGSVVIAGSEERELCAFNRTDGTRRWCRALGQIPRGLGISADGDTLYVGSLSGKVQTYRLEKTDVQ